MKISVLASGSKGNSCFIKTNNGSYLIDIGTTCGYVEKQLKDLNEDIKQIKGIFITHAHTDHINGLKVFIKKYNPVIYLTEKMYNEISTLIDINNYYFISQTLNLDDLLITSIKTSHDTDDSVGYIFEEDSHSFVYITDTGYINVKNHKKLLNKNLYVLESNHDVSMLMDNPKYPYHLKQRILGDKGHLSNEDSSYYLSKFIGEKTRTIILAHLSEHNNTKEIALNTLLKTLKENDKECDNIIVAEQNNRTELVEV